MGAVEEFRPISRHRTAIKRTDFSHPIRLALEHGLISETTTVFDYGCGHGGDVDRLREMGVAAEGWDPVYCPLTNPNGSDVVNLGYVINVIENGAERAAALRAAWNLARKLLVVSARLIASCDWMRPDSRNA
jgi:DNA phosphorothioation-associated putative methyltransferase